MAIIAKKVPPLRRTLHLLYEPLQRRQHLHEHILTYIDDVCSQKATLNVAFFAASKSRKILPLLAFTDIRTWNSAVESTRRQLAKLPVPFQKSNLNRLHSPHLATQHSTVINHMGQKNSAPMVVALWPAKESGQKVADSKASSRHPVILFIFSIFRLMRVFTSDWVKICMFHSSFYETHPQIGWIMLNRYPLHQRKTKWNCSTTLRSCLMATQLFRSKHRFDPAASIQNLKHWYHLKKDWWDVLIVSHLPRKVRKE